MEVFVSYLKTLHSFQLTKDAKVDELMKKIEKKISIAPQNQKLICHSTIMDNRHELLSTYKVKNKSKILLIRTNNNTRQGPATVQKKKVSRRGEEHPRTPLKPIFSSNPPSGALTPYNYPAVQLPTEPFIIYSGTERASKFSIESDAIFVEHADSNSERVFFDEIKEAQIYDIDGHEGDYFAIDFQTNFGKKSYSYFPCQYKALLQKLFKARTTRAVKVHK